MNSRQFHRELTKFAYGLSWPTINQNESGVDEVWKTIINDVDEYNKRDKYKYYYGFVPAMDFSIVQSDRPDIVYQCKDFIMGIECFEFDASKKNRRSEKLIERLIKSIGNQQYKLMVFYQLKRKLTWNFQ